MRVTGTLLGDREHDRPGNSGRILRRVKAVRARVVAPVTTRIEVKGSGSAPRPRSPMRTRAGSRWCRRRLH